MGFANSWITVDFRITAAGSASARAISNFFSWAARPWAAPIACPSGWGAAGIDFSERRPALLLSIQSELFGRAAELRLNEEGDQ